MKRFTTLALLINLLGPTLPIALSCDLESLKKSDIDTASIHRVVQNSNHCLWVLTEVHFFQNGEPYLRMSDTGGKISTDLAAFSRKENIVSEDPNGDTPLHSALRFENRVAVAAYAPSKTLLCHPQPNEFINFKNRWGDTPMHLAAQLSSPEYAMMLYRYGGKVNTRNITGKTPIDLAKARGFSKTQKFLENPEKEILPFDHLLSFFVPIAKGSKKSVVLNQHTSICPNTF